MAKILISDLLGTLVPCTYDEAEYLYSIGHHLHSRAEIEVDKEYQRQLLDKMFIQLGKQLEPFLRDGNYIKVVTSAEGHGGADFIAKELLSRFYKNVDQYSEQVSIFLVGDQYNLEELSRVASIHKHVGIISAKIGGKIPVTFINEKTKVFDFVRQEHNFMQDKLYAIGDSDNDIPMLLKCIEFFGQSALIYNGLYTVDLKTEKIIKETVSRNYEIMIEQLAYQQYPNYSDMENREKDTITSKLDRAFEREYKDWKKQEFTRLYALLREGKIDVVDLMGKGQIAWIIGQYNSFARFTPPGSPKRKTIDLERTNDLSLYPTFQDYCNKVLYKDYKS